MLPGELVELDSDSIGTDIETGRRIYYKAGHKLTFISRGADQDGLDDHWIFSTNNQIIAIKNNEHE
jgi:hypothetical protein